MREDRKKEKGWENKEQKEMTDKLYVIFLNK
jgi:hypothetical protein